jgi:hypothetical protein
MDSEPASEGFLGRVLGSPLFKGPLSFGVAAFACWVIPQPTISLGGNLDTTLYQTCVPLIGVLFIGFTIGRHDHYREYAYRSYRVLIMFNVILLAAAMIDALRILSGGDPLYANVGSRPCIDPILLTGAIAFSMTSLGLSFFRMLRPRRLVQTSEASGAIKRVTDCS